MPALPMFTTVDPPGLRADLQLVSGVQSEGKLYEWLSMVKSFRQEIPEPASLPDASLWKVVPPLCETLIKANEEGGDRERTHGQGPLIYSRSVIMWSGLKETEIEIQRGRKLYETEDRERDSKYIHGNSAKSLPPMYPSHQLSEVLVVWVRWLR